MQPKTLKILGALLGVLGVCWGLAMVASRTPEQKDKYLWEKAQDAKRLAIGDAVLVKSGTDWNMDKPFKTKADRSKIEDLLGKIAKVTLSDPISSDPSRQEYFMVTASSGVRLQGFLDEKGGSPALDVLVGKSGSDYDSVILRRPKENDVLEGRGIAHYEFEQGAARWADKTLAQIDKSGIRSIELRASTEAVHLQRGEGRWRLNGQKTVLSTATALNVVEPMVAKLARLDADDVMQETALSSTTARGLRNPELRIIVHYADGVAPGSARVVEKTIELAVAPKGVDSRSAVRKKGESLVYMVSSWQLDSFRKKRADFR